MKLAITLSSVLALAHAQAIPPANFQFPTANNQVSLQYQVNESSLAVQPGALFGINGELFLKDQQVYS